MSTERHIFLLFLLLCRLNDVFFPRMVDEIRDISGNEQLNIVVRVIDSEVRANNNHCYSKNIFSVSSNSMNINLNKCIAMCFDG